MVIIYFFIFILGLIVGSFLNSLIYRIKTGESFLFGRSHCPYCKHELSWKDLIPLLSFLMLKGRCRYCHKRISLQYPLVELSTSLMFVAIFKFLLSQNFANGVSQNPYFLFHIPYSLLLLYYLLAACFLIVIFVFDLRYYIIPDKIIYPAIIINLIFNFFTPLDNLLSNGARFSIFNQFSIFNFQKFFLQPLLAGAGASFFFFLLWLISRGKWMGFGDVKLVFFIGLLLGWPNILVALFFAFFIGAIIGVIQIILGKKSLKSQVPFGPFLVTGTFLAVFFGRIIINWYINLF